MYLLVGQPHQTWPTSRGEAAHRSTFNVSVGKRVRQIKTPRRSMDFLSEISTHPKAEPVFGGHTAYAVYAMCFKAGLSGNLQPVVDFSSFCISLPNLWFLAFIFSFYIIYLFIICCVCVLLYGSIICKLAYRQLASPLAAKSARYSGTSGLGAQVSIHIHPRRFTPQLHFIWHGKPIKPLHSSSHQLGGIHCALEETMLKSGGKIKRNISRYICHHTAGNYIYPLINQSRVGLLLLMNSRIVVGY